MTPPLTITMPLTEESIPQALDALREQLAVAQTLERAIKTAITNVQNRCSHPRRAEWVDGAGEGRARCEVCKKEL